MHFGINTPIAVSTMTLWMTDQDKYILNSRALQRNYQVEFKFVIDVTHSFSILLVIIPFFALNDKLNSRLAIY